MRTINLIAYTLLTLLGIALLTWIIPAQSPPSAGYGLAPATLPLFLAVVMLACSAWMLFSTWKDKDECGPNPLPFPVWMHLAKYMLVCLLAFPLIDMIGFLPGAFVVLVALQLLAGQRNVIALLAIAGLVTAAAYFGGEYGMGVPLPKGELLWN